MPLLDWPQEGKCLPRNTSRSTEVLGELESVSTQHGGQAHKKFFSNNGWTNMLLEKAPDQAPEPMAYFFFKNILVDT